MFGYPRGAPADRIWVQFTERLLASAIGAASARLVLTSSLRGTGMDLGEVVAVLDEAGQELRFNREILSTTLENIDQGVSVVDREMRLVAWNRRYQQLFDYPDGMLYVGRPVADLIRYNAERGELGELNDAAVLMVGDDVSTMRELLTALAIASEQHPLVIAAGAFHPDVVASLKANRRMLRLPVVAVTANPAELMRLQDEVGGEVLSSADLRAGWLPEGALGVASQWRSDMASTRVLGRSGLNLK